MPLATRNGIWVSPIIGRRVGVFRSGEHRAADHVAQPHLGVMVERERISLLMHRLLELLAQCAQLPCFSIRVHGLQSRARVGSSGLFGNLPECGFQVVAAICYTTRAK